MCVWGAFVRKITLFVLHWSICFAKRCQDSIRADRFSDRNQGRGVALENGVTVELWYRAGGIKNQQGQILLWSCYRLRQEWWGDLHLPFFYGVGCDIGTLFDIVLFDLSA